MDTFLKLLYIAGVPKWKSVHKRARVSRFVTLGPATPKTVRRPAKVSRFMT